jgi:50S ribosomal subunit-associated GTPase HflX
MPVIAIATRQDEWADRIEEATIEELLKKESDILRFCATSAKTGYNVDELKRSLIVLVNNTQRQERYLIPQVQKQKCCGG